MAQDRYDAIVVGARCAGSPTAMLLARQGYKVLVVDRATFPSDTLSTHVVHPPGAAALQRWGVLDRLTAMNLITWSRAGSMLEITAADDARGLVPWLDHAGRVKDAT